MTKPPKPQAQPKWPPATKFLPIPQVRDVIKVAVLPLSAASPEVAVDLTIRAEGGMAGIPAETLNLVVLEGLHQLGLQDIDVSIPPGK